jgi:hypothetical protein
MQFYKSGSIGYSREKAEDYQLIHGGEASANWIINKDWKSNAIKARRFHSGRFLWFIIT